MMFLRILFTTLTIPLLVSLWLADKAYSYPSSDEFTDLPQSYSLVVNTSSVEPETTTTTVPPTTQYQVNRGDTLFKIARDFEVDVNDLMAANGISDPRGLTIGQTLKIPTSGTGTAATNTQPKIIKK